MIYEVILKIAYWVLTILLGGVGLYFKYNTRLRENVEDVVNAAEELYQDVAKSGGRKFEWAVETLYDLIPTPLRVIFTKEMIGSLVQNTFDALEEYAVKQANKVANKILEK